VSRYGYDCPAGHEVILDATMRRAPDQIVCLEHDADAPRRFEPPQFTEDRLHFRRTGPGAPAENWSWTLGGPMPTSRAGVPSREEVERKIADRGWNEAESVTLKNPAP
jgi:hypothetical protein